MKIVLASKSPRRKRILKELGLKFRAESQDIDEKSMHARSPEETVMRIAEAKAEAAAKKHKDAAIIAADTLVYFKGKAIGQPKNEEDARNTLKSLLNKTHQVYSGICVIANGRKLTGCEKSELTLKEPGKEALENYIKLKLHEGKAGGYDHNDREFKPFIERIAGSKSNVTGLPVRKLGQMLKELGIAINTEGWD